MSRQPGTAARRLAPRRLPRVREEIWRERILWEDETQVGPRFTSENGITFAVGKSLEERGKLSPSGTSTLAKRNLNEACSLLYDAARFEWVPIGVTSHDVVRQFAIPIAS